MGEKVEARAWIGSLAAYTNGYHLGAWFDLEDLPANPAEWVDAMIERGEIPSAPGSLASTKAGRRALAQEHEELVAMDHEGLEWAGFAHKVVTLYDLDKAADFLPVLESRGVNLDAYRVFWEWLGHDPLDAATIDAFEESWAGSASSEADFAQSLYEEMGANLGDLESFIDWGRVARDLSMSGDYYFHEVAYDETWVFRSL